MPFSHHSHSGQFCNGHAKDSLEDVVKRAVALNMQVLALTEHIPRELECDLYPEEVLDAQLSPLPFSPKKPPKSLHENFKSTY